MESISAILCAFGVVIALIILITLCYCCWRKCFNKKTQGYDYGPLQSVKSFPVAYKGISKSSTSTFKKRGDFILDIENTWQQPLEQLDLHGCFANTALNKVIKHIQKGGSRGLEYVEVITGRGIHSPNGPVIKPRVQQFLINNGYRYQWMNGGGMVRIFLR